MWCSAMKMHILAVRGRLQLSVRIREETDRISGTNIYAQH
jgi:hypothetical protein